MRAFVNNKEKLLFYGVLPPENVDGIAISNYHNLGILKEILDVDVVQESNTLFDHNKITLQKVTANLKALLKISANSIRYDYKYFYLIFSLSTFGALKTFLAVIGFKLFSKGRVIIHIHRGDFFTRFLISRINVFLAKIIFWFVNTVIVLSESQKLKFESFYNKPCYVLINTVEHEYDSLRHEQDKEKSEIIFVYISNYLLDKGIIDLLDVFSGMLIHYPTIKLITYGNFSDNNLKKEILSHSCSRIIINGPITGFYKYKEIMDADCLILPSWNEGLPLVLLESMSVGTPLIITKVGLIPEVLGPHYPFYSLPGDKNALKSAIMNFIQSDRKDEISVELRKKYDENYSNSIHKEKLLKIISS